MNLQAPLAACLAVALFYGHDLLAQPLTSEEVAGPINAVFKPAASQCAAGKTVPALVKIEVLIQKDGSASMVSASPAVDPDVEACLKAAMEKVKFRASGQAFKAVYSFKPAPQEVSPPAQPVQPPAPAPAVPPSPPAAQPVPQAQYQEAIPATMVANAPAQKQGIKPAADRELYRRVRISRGVMIGGFAAFGAVWISMIFTSTFLWAQDIAEVCLGWEPCPDTEGNHVNVGSLAPLIGPFWSGADLLDAGYGGMGIWYILNPVLQIALFTAGIAGLAMMVTSYKRMHKKQSVYKVAFLPLITRSPGKGQMVGGMLAGFF